MTSIRDAISCKFRARARSRTACSAPWTCRSSTIAARNSPSLAKRCSRAARRFSRPRARSSSSLLGHRRLGSGDRQHAVAGRQGADGRDRPFRHAVAAHGGALGHRGRIHAGRLAPRRRPRRDRGEARAGQSTRHQGGDGGAQRDLHRRRPAGSARSAPRSTGPAIRRCCWSTPSPRSARSITGTTSGRSTSPSAARRRDSCCRRGSASTPSPRRRAPPPRPTRCRGPIGIGKRCSSPTPPASSPIRRRPTCSTACAKPSRCCWRRGWTTCSPATSALRPRPAPRSPIGALKCCASNRRNIRRC